MSMNLSLKIPLAFALALLTLLGAGVAGLWFTGQAMAALSAEAGQRLAHERSVAALQDDFKTQVQEWKNVLLRGADAALLAKHWQSFQKHQRAVEDGAKALSAQLREPALRDKLAAFSSAYAPTGVAYRAGYDKFVAAGYESSVGDLAVRGIDREPAQRLNDLADAIAAHGSARAAAAQRDSERAAALALGGMLLASACGVALGVALARGVTRPLARAVVVADAVAQGDLGQAIDTRGSDEPARLMQALAGMQTQLRTLVGQVRGNAEQLANASADIARGSGDLAVRTEEQASALQQTGGAMQSLDGTVRRNADNAVQARALAGGAQAVAERGGNVVREVVDTMRGINDSSKKIADIIGTIDGIAFQTNILALNAAVEAARAGEQGRGFAVVAAEVRSLAQRSAAAAREIKGLISASVERVAHGSTLVDRAGDTMQEVVAAIGRVSAIVAEISHASEGQSQGVDQVGVAVRQLDQSTQQNAELVQHTSMSAESLRVQADTLVRLVQAFKLDAATA